MKMKTFLPDSFITPLIHHGILFPFVLIFFSLSAFSQDYASIYVYRAKKIKSTGVDFKIYLNKLEIAQVPNGGRLEYRYYKTGRINLMCGVFSEYGGMDTYDDNITLDIEKGKSYYLKGEGRNLSQVSNEIGKKEFENNENFKGGVILNDDKVWVAENHHKVSAPVKGEPEIVISNPKMKDGEFKTKAAGIKFSGYAVSHSNIKSVKVNGNDITSDEAGNFSTGLKLKEGLNKVTVAMDNEAGQINTRIINIIREADESGTATEYIEEPVRVSNSKSDVDINVPVTSLQKNTTYCLIFGNEDYSSYQPGLNSEINVDYALNDAIVFKEYCIKTLGVPEKHVKYIGNATTGQMNQGIEWLSNLAKIEDGNAELIFYYSGHGLPDEITKEAYLIPVDVNGSNVKYAIKLADVYKKLNEFKTKKVTVFLDACFSGGARNKGLVAVKGIKIKPKPDVVTGNMVVVASSTGEESSGVYKEKQHGYMTYFLLKKLQESSGNIIYKDLIKYITDSVKKETALNGKIQTPQVNFGPPVANTWEQWKVN